MSIPSETVKMARVPKQQRGAHVESAGEAHEINVTGSAVRARQVGPISSQSMSARF